MFNSLSEKLQGVFGRLRGKGTLREQDVAEALREIRLALLEADVNFKVVKDLVARIKERAVGAEILESLTPAQHVVKIVDEELCAVLGADESRITYSAKPPTVIMMVGLQGSGKTTTCGKLAMMIRKQGRRPLLVACDVYRPAAIKQLQVVGEGVKVPVHADLNQRDVVRIALDGIRAAQEQQCDVVIVDTAGRLHVDEEMMAEVKRLQQAVQPTEALLVLDAMTGQDAVNVATQFTERLNVTGFVLTKLDGDTRGGAAISIRAVTGKPIKFMGVGEKAEALEPFHPDRMASRILGMGDVLSVIEKAQLAIDEKTALALEKKILSNRFDLDDYLSQLVQVRKMGPLDQLLKALPGFGGANMDIPEVDEKQLDRVQAIIQSMTREERREPDILNGSRRRRIARGSGTTVQDVNRLLKQFDEMRKMFSQVHQITSGKKKMPRLPRMPFRR
ncbi:MAG: signal recognition particle protein [Armatimonadetes bacterium]|jgi:signal recognition particle subunit SRP54|nr:signal recognition particle protein [Armatimonadota bacterium]